jgi:hypothetical protein
LFQISYKCGNISICTQAAQRLRKGEIVFIGYIDFSFFDGISPFDLLLITLSYK